MGEAIASWRTSFYWRSGGGGEEGLIDLKGAPRTDTQTHTHTHTPASVLEPRLSPLLTLRLRTTDMQYIGSAGFHVYYNIEAGPGREERGGNWSKRRPTRNNLTFQNFLGPNSKKAKSDKYFSNKCLLKIFWIFFGLFTDWGILAV